MNQKRLPQLVCLNTCIPNFIHFYQKTIFSFLCLWVGISSSIFAQIADNKGFQQRILPSSPNAAALGKFGDVPVSAYTGVPNISVPIAELKGFNKFKWINTFIVFGRLNVINGKIKSFNAIDTLNEFMGIEESFKLKTI